ncbi:hypothetical protein RND81_07G160700 [Saponaria officinalis]|uniref:Prolamin-like domain-containing protein n=1 Tax=Saponaria officinalis TaxID=3572 RepID=A0AAW1JRI6_SAPOF
MEFKATSSVNLLVTIILLFVTSFVLARPNTIVESVPAPYSHFEDYQVQKCASKIGETCGNSIFHYIFGAGKHVSKECCTILLKVGEKCHDLLTTVTIRLEHFPKQQAKDIRRKNDKAWKLCKKYGQISN